MFVDQTKVTFVAGKGGNGCLSFRREKNIPRGGPDGGRGGNGGSVILRSRENVRSLVYFRFHPLIRARKGAHGEGSKRQGRRGADFILDVPVGTVVREEGSETPLFDFTAPDMTFRVVRGGRGGRGNASYATSTERAPRIFEEGLAGDERTCILELKMIADVGLVGFPNVGKSTIIARVSAARPVIADYPFTTLIPNLGVVDVGEYKSFVLADIPGLIEGAHTGQGLGIRFLKHVERTRILVHVIDVSPLTGRDPVEDYKAIMKELAAFDEAMVSRPQIVVANKIDLLGDDESRLDDLRKFMRRKRLPFFAVSALETRGLREVVLDLARRLED
jgi:GTPase